MANIQPRKKCIAVIGAGAGGLATAKYLLAENCHVTFFERKAGPGGVWNTGPGSENFPMPVHEGLETNVPRNLMTFSDLRRPITTSLFPTSSDVNDHLHSYAEQLRAQYPSDDKLTFNFNTKRGQSAEVHTASYASVESESGKALHWGGPFHRRASVRRCGCRWWQLSPAFRALGDNTWPSRVEHVTARHTATLDALSERQRLRGSGSIPAMHFVIS